MFLTFTLVLKSFFTNSTSPKSIPTKKGTITSKIPPASRSDLVTGCSAILPRMASLGIAFSSRAFLIYLITISPLAGMAIGIIDSTMIS